MAADGGGLLTIALTFAGAQMFGVSCLAGRRFAGGVFLAVMYSRFGVRHIGVLRGC
jgi:hypothetical protein